MSEECGHGACCILVIDDDTAVSDATGMMLEACGYDVSVADDGITALAGVQDGWAPDLVIADYRLPGDNGLEVVCAIRRMLGRQVPAIIITGDTSATTVRSSGVPDIGFFRKPMDADVLVRRIEDWRRTGTWLD